MAACLRRVVLLYFISLISVNLAEQERFENNKVQQVYRETLNRHKRAVLPQQPQLPVQNVNAFNQNFPNQPVVPQKFGAAGNVPGNIAGNPPLGNMVPQQKMAGQGFAQPGMAGQGQGINNAQVVHDAQRAAERLRAKPGALQTVHLIEAPECAEDIRNYCGTREMKRSNFAVLDCLQDLEVDQHISGECQHLLWQYKRNLTKDERFELAGKEVCAKELHEIPECEQLAPNSGLRLPCLVEHMDNASVNCRVFLQRMAKIIFSDYRFIFHFMEHCETDIQKYRCGRVQPLDQDPDSVHSQGRTLVCLAQHVGDLQPVCKKQVLRVAELQSDDYHMDRALYYACREDRETFCPKVKAGGGKVFDCLFKHKLDEQMSPECRDSLVSRQKLIHEDVKVSRGFIVACRENIKEHKCFREGDPSYGMDIKRSHVLICLENALKRDQKINAECIREMDEMRQSLMEDYQISPEVVTKCDHEISTLCKDEGVGGNTIHCLMKHANERNQIRGKALEPAELIRPQCKIAIEDLLKEADVGEDFTMDRLLHEACMPVAEQVCKGVDPGNSRVINCLMENLDADQMTDECEERLLEIQYFVVRDFELDAQLYRVCKKEAQEHCNVKEDWMSEKGPDMATSSLVLPCLYRFAKHEPGKVSNRCAHEVKRVMRQRAKRVDLEPKVENNCLLDLAMHCSDDDTYEKGMEMDCLEDHYDELSQDCKEVMEEFIEEEDEDIQLDAILMKSCTPMIKRFCGDLLKDDADAAEVMDCLIENKRDPDMGKKCAIGIEHHQLVSLKDYRFTHKFKEACKADVVANCPGKTKKSEVVICLSEMVRNNTLRDEEHKISKECRRQLRVEVLRRGETVELDPALKEGCYEDIDKFCRGIEAGNAQVIECLKNNQRELSKSCHKIIFNREKDEAQFGDFSLFTICKPMIKQYCRVTDTPGDIFKCLKNNKDQTGFDQKCREIIFKRQELKSKDYRLNLNLMKSCGADMKKFCKEILMEAEGHPDDELEGKVIHCLKKKMVKQLLTARCEEEIKGLVKESQSDYRLDPVLLKACKKEISQLCQQEVAAIEDGTSPEGRVEECLKEKLYEGKLKHDNTACLMEVARLAVESRVDIHVDTVLQEACQKDVVRFCGEIDRGEGRHMACLLTILEDSPKRLQPKCLKGLRERKALWEYAAQAAPPESMGDLAEQVMMSPSKFYLMGVVFSMIGLIFIVGITCGRVTKRVTAENKNK